MRALLLVSLALSFLFSSCISTLREYQVQHYHFYSPDVPPAWDQYRMALISDIHIWDTRHLKTPAARQRQAHLDMLRMREIAQILKAEPSQLLLLAGDYLSYRGPVHDKIELGPYLAPLRNLGKNRKAEGYQRKVAVLGNHDHFLLPRNRKNPTIKALEAAGIQVLVNDTLRIPAPQSDLQQNNSQGENSQNTAGQAAGEAAMYIVGIDDYLYGKREPGLLAKLSTKDFVVALAHNPDSFDLLKHPERVDLALAGHLHGGQITFFGLAPVVSAQRKYLRQPFQGPDFPVFVSNGLGASGIQLRVMAPPQIWFITLHHSKDASSENPRKLPAMHKPRTYKAKHPQQKYRLTRSKSIRAYPTK